MALVTLPRAWLVKGASLIGVVCFRIGLVTTMGQGVSSSVIFWVVMAGLCVTGEAIKRATGRTVQKGR